MGKRVRPSVEAAEATTGPADPHGAARPSLSRAQTAEYVASLTGELALLARHTGLDTLAYLLEMARFEAVSHSEGKPKRVL